ncbi:uncharacterized protein LOC110464735 isoform X1 [Mizuhopecten yessoensis]|uniref:uncharacterized protein LOC110464735 isoform X1 n=1 Tax=Mizuhopecten yessoensis TaxID=6573 RepID=UPI000B45E9C2|nr:uncharacterized protein LOC110464735 isoform X1 [Mizuhopecten yessoensis]
MAVFILLLVLCLGIHASVTADPCLTYDNFTADSTRSPSHVDNNNCDAVLTEKWYRLVGDAGTDLTNDSSVLVSGGCGTQYQLWMNATMPDVSEGIVDRKICMTSPFSNCHSSFTVQVKNCCSFRVYYLKSATNCPQAYCVSPSLVPPVDCPGPSTNSSTSVSTASETTTSGDTTTSISTKETKATKQTTSAKTDEVTTPASERSSNPVIIVLVVVCVVLFVLFIGLSFALYMRCKREKGLPDSTHFGNAAMHYSKDTSSAFTENTLNSHYEQMQSKSQSDGEYQDINDMYLISEKPKQENCIEGPYYVLNPSTMQSHQSPYEDLKSPTSSNPYDILSESAADSNKASKMELREEDANHYTKI